MKTVSDVLKAICKRSPFSAAEEWDNVGLLVGDASWEVGRIHVALDATDEVIKRAASLGADLLVTHHPMIFSPLKKIVADDFIGRRVISLIENHIAYVAMHTNYDVFGMADLAAEKLSLSDTIPLDWMAVEETSKVGSWSEDAGIGRVGLLKEPLSVRDLAKKVKEVFGASSVSYFGDGEKSVLKVAICPGSGKSLIDQAIQEKAQVLITGDVDHHSGIDAVARGLSIIDAGHYGIEHIFIEDQADYLRNALGGEVEVTTEPFAEPIHTV